MTDSPSKRKRESMTEHQPSKLQHAPHEADQASQQVESAPAQAHNGAEPGVAVPVEQPWHAAFPSPALAAEVMPQRRVFTILSMKIASLLVVDVRRTDYEGGFIRGSINIPAQGFWWNRGMLYELAYKSGMEWVVFTCGSSNGRGPRCAGWFLDHVRNVAGDDDMQVMVLEGGIKGWVKAGPEYTQLMDGYRQEYWEELFATENSKKAAATTKTIDPNVSSAIGAGDVAP